MPKEELKKLSTTTRDLFNFVSEFGKLHGGRDEINPQMIRYKKIENDICGIFQMYFYESLFLTSFETSIINNEKLTKRTIRKLLNEIFKLWHKRR